VSELAGTRRPTRALLAYYVLSSIAAGPGLVVLIPLRIFRYRTLRYDFHAEGMTARWGILFRREISLTYARIQDIHLVSNLVERWLGLGRVEIQTASGQSGAELTIEGLPDFERIRDQLYARMRGARPAPEPHEEIAGSSTSSAAAAVTDDAVAALRAAVDELRAIRELLAASQHASRTSPKP
jgi:membrane protein YdbS with pleckstrin-like domain